MVLKCNHTPCCYQQNRNCIEFGMLADIRYNPDSVYPTLSYAKEGVYLSQYCVAWYTQCAQRPAPRWSRIAFYFFSTNKNFLLKSSCAVIRSRKADDGLTRFAAVAIASCLAHTIC